MIAMIVRGSMLKRAVDFACGASPLWGRWAVAIFFACAVFSVAGHGQARPDQAPGVTRAASRVLLTAARAEGGRLVVAGERGIILLSDDAGRTWREAQVPARVSITNVKFSSKLSAWAVGHEGVLLHSTDGGSTWVKQLDGDRAAAIELDAAQTDASANTEDGQRRVAEAKRMAADGADKPLFDVHFYDESNGIVVGAYGTILATSDAGLTWRSLRGALKNPKGKHLYAISATNSSLYLVGEQGAVYRADTRSRFTEVKTPYVGSYFGVLGSGSDGVLIFGLRGNVYRSLDNGSRWERIDLGSAASVTAGLRLDDGSVVLVDDSGRVLRSRDGGSTFQPVPVAQPYPFTSVVQASDGALIVTGARGVQRVATVPASINESKN